MATPTWAVLLVLLLLVLVVVLYVVVFSGSGGGSGGTGKTGPTGSSVSISAIETGIGVIVIDGRGNTGFLPRGPTGPTGQGGTGGGGTAQTGPTGPMISFTGVTGGILFQGPSGTVFVGAATGATGASQTGQTGPTGPMISFTAITGGILFNGPSGTVFLGNVTGPTGPAGSGGGSSGGSTITGLTSITGGFQFPFGPTAAFLPTASEYAEIYADRANTAGVTQILSTNDAVPLTVFTNTSSSFVVQAFGDELTVLHAGVYRLTFDICAFISVNASQGDVEFEIRVNFASPVNNCLFTRVFCTASAARSTSVSGLVNLLPGQIIGVYAQVIGGIPPWTLTAFSAHLRAERL